MGLKIKLVCELKVIAKALICYCNMQLKVLPDDHLRLMLNMLMSPHLVLESKL